MSDQDQLRRLSAVELHGRIYILPEGALEKRSIQPLTSSTLHFAADIVISDHGRVLKNREAFRCGPLCQEKRWPT